MPSKDACTEEQFLKDIEQHEMQIIKDDGVYRHICFKRPNSHNMYFDLVTYPGHLVFSGDMGCYVFSRLIDMFEFFRSDRREQKDGKLYINSGYWAEKLQAVDCAGSGDGNSKAYDQARMEEVIKEQRLAWIRERELDKDQRRALWDEMDNLLADLNGEEGHDYHLVNDWSWMPFTGAVYSHGSTNYHFQDLWDHNFREYTFHFLWCCYAIAWGIQQYDNRT